MLRGRDVVLISTLVGCGLGISLIFTAIGPVLSTIATHFGGGTRGNVIAQFMMTLPSIGVIIGGPLLGVAATRWGTRALLFGALTAYGIFGCAGFLIDSATPLLTTRFMLGVAAVGVATASTTLIGNLLQGASRTRVLGYSSAVASIGSVVSIFIAGKLADYGGWQLPFAIYGVAFVLLAMALVSVPRQEMARPGTAVTESMATASVLEFWPLYVAVIAVTVVVFMTGIQVSFLLAANGITKPGDQAWIIASASVGATIGALVYGFAQQRIGRDRTFILCLSAMGVGNLVMGSQHQEALLALGCLLNGLGAGMTVPHFSSRIIDKAPIAVRPRALGLMFTMIFAGEFVNPWIVTPIRLWLGISAAFVAIGAAALTAALVLTVFQKHSGNRQ
jgi:MFS family permease